jgi:peptidoglycan/LPS O-acetylase OafA/YrhL
LRFSPAYKPEVDGLRAVAVLSIFAFHLQVAGFSGGFVGVDIFFVISGFVITRGILRDLESGTFSLRAFYARRTRRILPALIATLVATLAAGFVLLSPAELQELAESALATLAFAANLFFHDRTGYFANAGHYRPLLHMWSLGIEEQFYIAVPWAVAALQRRGVAPAKSMLGIVLTSFAYCVVATSISEKHGFYMPMARVWEIAAGGCIAIAEQHGLMPRKSALPLAVAGALAVVASVHWLDNSVLFPGWIAALPVLGTAVLIYASTGERTPIARALQVPPLVFIGRISYSLYLVHWPMIVFWRICLARPLMLQDQVAILAISVLLAAASSSFIERPLRAGSSRLASTPVLAGIVTAGVAVAAFAGVVAFERGAPWRMNPAARAAIATLQDALDRRPRCIADNAWLAHAPVKSSACRWNGGAGKAEFVVWGDSHAQMFAPELATLFAAAGLDSGIGASLPDCPPLQGILVTGRKNQEICVAFVDAVMRAIERDRPRYVVVAGRWALLASDVRAPGDGRRSGTIIDLENGGRPIALADALIRTLQRMTAAGTRVILIGPVPEIEYNIPSTLVRALQGIGIIPVVPRAAFDQRQKTVLAALARAGAMGGVQTVYPHTVLCNQVRCAVTDGSRALYIDDDHLSPFGSASVVEQVRRSLLE